MLVIVIGEAVKRFFFKLCEQSAGLFLMTEIPLLVITILHTLENR